MFTWQEVPKLVSSRLKAGSAIQERIRERILRLDVPDPGRGYIYWHPDTKEARLVLPEAEPGELELWSSVLSRIDGIDSLALSAEPPPREDWIRLKRAADGTWMHAPYRWAGALTGGPSPMTNSLVSALLAGGLGYGAGTALEHLLPEQFVDRGRLRKTLGLLGAGFGAAIPGIGQTAANYKIMENPSVWRAFASPDAAITPSPDILNRQRFYDATKGAEDKTAWTGAAESTPVPVDAFNRAIWNDVHNGLNSSMQTPYGTRSPFGPADAPIHTPPHVAAATSGLVTGVQQMYGNTPLLSPMHFVKGLAAAGTDMITARVAGGVLGALGGLKPEAQKKLQNMGLWSGLVRGVAGSVLGVQ